MKTLTKNIVRYLLLLQCTLFSSLLLSQTDYEFWFVAPAVSFKYVPPSPILNSYLNSPIAIYFTIASGSANVTIEQPANPAFVPIHQTVTSNTATEVILTSVLDQIENKPADSVLNCGLRVTSDQPVTAFYEVQSPFNASTYTLLGKNALGTEFIIPSQNHHSNYEYSDPPARNVFDIVATEDTTIVTIIPKSALIGHPANDTFQIVLNRGQTWSGRAASGDSTAHLGGSFVLSDKPVAITFTDDAVFFANTMPDAIDLTGDQLLPRHLAGEEFIIHGQFARSSIVYCYAFEDSTIINFRDSLQNQTNIINRGDEIQYLFDSADLSTMASVNSTKPILVYYFGGFGTNVPPSSSHPQAYSAIVPPLNCGGTKRVCFTRTPPGTTMKWWDWLLVTRTGNESGFSIIPDWIQPPAPGHYHPVPGTFGEYVYTWMAFINFPMYATVIITNSKGNFQMSANSNDPITSTSHYDKFSFFSDFSNLYLGSDRHICPGDSTILDAGYGRDSYLWNTGDTTQSIWVKNPGSYWVYIAQDGCFLGDTIVISYYWTNPINLGCDTIVCAGDSILLDAGPGRGWYAWNTGDSTQTISVNQTGTYWVKALDVHCIVQETINITRIDSIDIGPNRSFCHGDSTLLDAGPGMTSYLWNTGETTQTIWAKDSIKYTVTVTLGTCVFSDSLMVSFLAVPEVNLGPDISICLGQTHTFDAGFCSGCTYSWDDLSTNQMNIGTGQTYTTGQAGTYRITVTGSNGCHTRDTIQLFTNAYVAVSITITSSLNIICAGTQVTFTATPINEGTTPIYQWKVNGIDAGTNNPIYSFLPSDGDVISCILTSSETTCITNNPATSNTITIVVNPNLPVSISVATSANPVCTGTPVTYTATPVNGGTAPQYQWKVNGTISGTNNPVYTYVPANGDLVWCELTSSEVCTSNNPASSIQHQMVVTTNLIVSVSISASANPVCVGNLVTFTATPVNGGTTPIYQWKVNGIDAGTDNPIYSYLPSDGDVVSCILTSSETTCITNNPVTSNTVTMTQTPSPDVSFTRCFDSVTNTGAKPFKLKGGLPLEGIYSGPGVNSLAGVFTPSAAGIGLKTIVYTYTNVFSCSAYKIKTILIQANPIFTCGNDLTDPRDGRTYRTIQVGSRCWMGSNLNYGTWILSSIHQTDNCIVEKYCPNDQQANCTTGTAAYQWDELIQYSINVVPDYQGLCPPGWHIPSSAEFQSLIDAWHGGSLAGAFLTDLYLIPRGFEALLQGMAYLNTAWAFTSSDYLSGTFFWTSTPGSVNKIITRGVNNRKQSVSMYESSRANAFPVRCLKD